MNAPIGSEKLKRDRQQQRDRQRRADPGQDADQHAEGDAEDGPQQVHRVEHGAEAVQQVAEDTQGDHSPSTPSGSEMSRNCVNAM